MLAAPLVAQVQRAFKLDELRVPPGFEVGVFARVPGSPRLMTFGPNGVLYAAALGGQVLAIPEQDKVVTVLSGLHAPHSVDFHQGSLYVATADALLRFDDAITPDLVIRSRGTTVVSLPDGGQHTSRTAFFGPEGHIYVTAGSTCNFCIEGDSRRAAMMRFDADGSYPILFAKGLRNTVSFAWHPMTGELWSVDNGGDGLGDDVPPEEVNVLREGADYGWPDCYGAKIPVSWGGPPRPDGCAATIAPEWQMQAHSAPLGISFYQGWMFPASWQGDALIGFHGSWNRSVPTGAKVVRVRASSGRATGIEDFLWGFLDEKGATRSGRPVHAISGPDGAVYVSDDMSGNIIYRIAYSGPRINPAGIGFVIGRVYAMYGVNLTSDPEQAQVTVDDIPARILYAGPGQVNFVVPDGLSGDVKVVLRNEKASDEQILRLVDATEGDQ